MSESQPDPFFGESEKTDLKAYKEAANKYSGWIREAIESDDRHLLEGLVKKYATRLGSMLRSIQDITVCPAHIPIGDELVHIDDGSPEEEEGRHFYNVGNMCVRREKYELAVAMYEQALRTFKHPSVLSNMASSFKRLGEYGKALECYSRAIKMDPSYAVGYARAAVLIEAYALSSRTPAIEYINNYLSKGGRPEFLREWAAFPLTPPDEQVALGRLLSQI